MATSAKSASCPVLESTPLVFGQGILPEKLEEWEGPCEPLNDVWHPVQPAQSDRLSQGWKG